VAGVEQPFDCLVIQNCQAIHSIGRTVKDSMIINGLSPLHHIHNSHRLVCLKQNEAPVHFKQTIETDNNLKVYQGHIRNNNTSSNDSINLY